jgi:hypothetical protein
MDLNIDSIIGKIEHNADKAGMLVGALSGLKEHAWGQDVMAGFNTIINGLITDPHIPDLTHVWQHITYEGNNTFKTGAAAALIGYLLKELDLDPQLNRIGKLLSKGGWGAVLGVVGLNILVYSGAAHSPVTVAGSPKPSSGVPIGPRSVSLATSYREIPIGGAF